MKRQSFKDKFNKTLLSRKRLIPFESRNNTALCPKCKCAELFDASVGGIKVKCVSEIMVSSLKYKYTTGYCHGFILKET